MSENSTLPNVTTSTTTLINCAVGRIEREEATPPPLPHEPSTFLTAVGGGLELETEEDEENATPGGGEMNGDYEEELEDLYEPNSVALEEEREWANGGISSESGEYEEDDLDCVEESDDGDVSVSIPDDDGEEDNEATIDEEERFAAGFDAITSHVDELQELQDDAELSIEELRRKYYSGAVTVSLPPETDEEKPRRRVGRGKSSKHLSALQQTPTASSFSSSAAPVVTTRRAHRKAVAAAAANAKPSSLTALGIISSAVNSTLNKLHGHQGNNALLLKSEKTAGGVSQACSQKEGDGEFAFYDDEIPDEDDVDYKPPEYWRKDVRIGSEYQIDVLPDFVSSLSPIDDFSEEKGELLWKPNVLSEDEVNEFLCACEKLRFQRRLLDKKGDFEPKNQSIFGHGSMRNVNGDYSLSTTKKTSNVGLGVSRRMSTCSDSSEWNAYRSRSRPVPDNEYFLSALLSAKFSVEAAKSQLDTNLSVFLSCGTVNVSRRTQPVVVCRWNEEECMLFENGLQELGKHFYKIHREKLPRRSVGELIQFYYAWKKTERYDLFVAKIQSLFQQQQQTHVPQDPGQSQPFLPLSRLDPANCTDFMGHIIEQHNATLNGRSQNSKQQKPSFAASAMAGFTHPPPEDP